MDWSAVDYCDVFILTAPIHCRASIAETLMQRHISTNLIQTKFHFQHIYVPKPMTSGPDSDGPFVSVSPETSRKKSL